MKTRKPDTQVEQEVQKTLAAMERIPRVEAPPFARTRIMARIKEREQHHSAQYAAQFGLVAAMFVLLVVVNLGILAQYWAADTTENAANISYNRNEELQNLASAFSFTNDSFSY